MPERSSSEIRRDLDRTRAELDATIDRLTQRLTVREIAADVWRSIDREGTTTGDLVAAARRDPGRWP